MSLRGRLLGALVALTATGLVVVGAVSYAALRSYLFDRIDRQAVQAIGQAERQLLDKDDGPPPLPPGGHRDPGGPGGPGGPPPSDVPTGTYEALRNADGRVTDDFLQTFGATGAQRPRLPAELPLSRRGQDTRLVDADGYRFLAVPATGGGSLVIGVPLDDVESTLGRLLKIELIVAAAVLLALAAAAWWLVRLGLAPLERMGRTAGAIAAGDLSRRVEPATQRTEVGRLGVALNAMLVQIERAFAERTASEDRLRRFLSDASHELRTPLSSIRGYAELYRIGATRDEADRAKAMARIESEAARMGVLVEDLLTLARLDEERELVREEVDLGAIAHDAVDAARAADPDRSISLEAGEPVAVDGDAARLRQVIDNLVRNALTHTPPGTPVELRVRAQGGHARLQVRDHGPGLPPGDPGALFDRFWRAEGGRERGRAGAGLGLAIVAGIVAAHHGTVSAADAAGGGACFEVVLPLHGSSAAAQPSARSL